MINTSNGVLGPNASSITGSTQNAGAVSASRNAAGSQSSNASALGPATQIDISDRTKQILQQNEQNMTALDKLQSIISALKGNINSDDGKNSQLDLDKSQNSNTPEPLGMSMLEQFDSYIKKQHTGKDGRISNYDVTISDISLTPKTDKEIDNWFKNDGAIIASGVFDGDSADYKEMVQAIKDKKISFIDAKYMPDLNYHNKATFQGGEGGSSPGLTRTYNTNSEIFKDSAKGYYPLADGTVLSWTKSS